MLWSGAARSVDTRSFVLPGVAVGRGAGEAGRETGRDPVLGQQLERKECSGHHDDVDSSRFADHPVRDVRFIGSGVRDVTHVEVPLSLRS